MNSQVQQNPKRSVGVLAMPWVGVPTSGMGSLSLVAHHITRPLAGEFDFTLIGGQASRDRTQEVAGIEYRAISNRWDRRFARRWSDVSERWQGKKRHPFYREVFYPFYARQAAKAFRASACDTVLVFQFPQWLAAVRRRLPRAKLWLWAQAATMVEEHGRVREQLAIADGVIACSRYIAERIEQRVPAMRGKTRVVYNGFDPLTFGWDANATRSTRELLYVGRITAAKGVHVLVDAFRRLASHRPDLRLTLAGPIGGDPVSQVCGTDPAHLAEIAAFRGDFRRELLERAGDAAPRVRFTGPLKQRQLGQLYRRAAVFVHPALWEEPFGMPVVEAMACGTPVIASRRGGIPELIEPGKTGLLVPSGDRTSLVNAIQSVLDRPAWSDHEQIANHAKQRFTWLSSANALRQVLLEEAVASPLSRAAAA